MDLCKSEYRIMASKKRQGVEKLSGQEFGEWGCISKAAQEFRTKWTQLLV